MPCSLKTITYPEDSGISFLRNANNIYRTVLSRCENFRGLNIVLFAEFVMTGAEQPCAPSGGQRILALCNIQGKKYDFILILGNL
jgi:hypothetical protein